MAAPVARTASAVIAFTVPAVPTGMKAGVGTSPCAVCSTPARAAPSVAAMRWENAVTALVPTGRRRHRSRSDSPPRSRAHRRAHPLGAGKGADQHEQRRTRQMEVGQQQIDRAEPVARHDEQRGVAGKRADASVVRRRGLQQAEAGGAHRHHAPARRARGIDRGGGVRGDLAAFACMRCCAISSERTGRKVPAPTCSVMVTRCTPRRSSASSSAGVKCSPAVGAATAPSWAAKMVW